MPPHPLTNFEKPKYYQNDPKFNAHSEGNLKNYRKQKKNKNIESIYTIQAYNLM